MRLNRKEEGMERRQLLAWLGLRRACLGMLCPAAARRQQRSLEALLLYQLLVGLASSLVAHSRLLISHLACPSPAASALLHLTTQFEPLQTCRASLLPGSLAPYMQSWEPGKSHSALNRIRQRTAADHPTSGLFAT